MKPITSIVFSALVAFPGLALAGDLAVEGDATPLELWEADRTIVFDASDVSLDDFLWVARPVVVFADTDRNPEFQRQVGLLQADLDSLAERDVVIITDATPDPMSDIRRQLRPRGFMLVLMGKDGVVELRKPSAWSVRELSRSIDKMPLRQQEIRERGLGG